MEGTETGERSSNPMWIQNLKTPAERLAKSTHPTASETMFLVMVMGLGMAVTVVYGAVNCPQATAACETARSQAASASRPAEDACEAERGAYCAVTCAAQTAYAECMDVLRADCETFKYDFKVRRSCANILWVSFFFFCATTINKSSKKN